MVTTRNQKKAGLVLCTALVLGALAAALAFPAPALAQVSVSLEAQRTNVQVGDIFDLVVTVSGTRSSGKPSFFGLQDFDAVGSGSTSKFNFTNGQASSAVEYRYQLTAKKEGVFQVGPARVEVDGKTYDSGRVTIKVSGVPALQGEQEGPMFLTAKMSAEKAYPGQELTYTLIFYWSNDVQGLDPAVLPEVEGLVFQQVGQPQQYNVVRHGKRYGAVEITMAVTASKFQSYEIPPASMRAKIPDGQRRSSRFPGSFFDDDFFSRQATRSVMVHSNPVSFTVLPFPEDGRPQDFHGLVGSFSAKAELQPRAVKAGESATVTLTMEGQGNVRLLPDLTFPALPGVKVYADQPVFTEDRTGQGMTGKKVMKWALVPQAEGKVEVPAFSIAYLDPETGRYQTASTSPMSLEVLPGQAVTPPPGPAETPAKGPAKLQVKMLGADILEIHDSPDALSPGLGQAMKPWMALLILLLPLLPVAGSLIVRRMSHIQRTQAKARGAKKALGNFTKAVKGLGPESAPELLKALQAYLALRLELDAATLTSHEAEARLASRGVDKGLAQELFRSFSRLEACVFSPGAQCFDEAMKQELVKIVRRMDKKV